MNPLISIKPIHILFISTLCLVHLGFHFLDFYAFDSQSFFENTLILTSFDAYHYAKFTREFLEILNTPTLNTFINALGTFPFLSLLGGILAKLTSLNFSLSFSSIIFSFTTIAILYFLIYATLKILNTSNKPQPKLLFALLAFISSLIALLLPSFYQRVGAGYFDTDMLLLMLPLSAIFFLMQFLKHGKFISLSLFGIFGYLAINWHNGIQNLFLLGFLLFATLECFLAFKKRAIQAKTLALIPIFFVILTPSAYCLFILILFLLCFKIFPKSIKAICLLSILYAIYFGLFNPLFAQIQAYFFGSTQHAQSFIYASVVNAILETTPISFKTLLMRSGGGFIFITGILGFLLFLLFAFLKKNFALIYVGIFFLPFLLLGFLSLKLGGRFSFFLTPILALGFGVFAYYLLLIFKKFSAQILCFLSAIIVLFITTLNYQIPTAILSKNEIQAFKELDSKLTSNDFIFSWWDYGYALRYFTKAQILLDGGRHFGAINYPIAKILLSDSKELFYNLSFLLAQSMQNLPPKTWSQILPTLLKQTNTQNIESFFKSISQTQNPIALKNNAQIYWVLPLRILPLLANINSFANLNPHNGKPIHKSTFIYWTQNPPKIQTNSFINLYENFYTLSINTNPKNTLTQVNFGKNSFLLSEDYLKSNIISLMLFQNTIPNVCTSGSQVRIYHLKDSTCAESPEQ